MNKTIPIYEAYLSDEETGVFKISLVETPAIEVDFVAYNEQKEQVRYAIVKDKQELVGALLIPEQLIYRNQDGKEYFVKYTTESIAKIAEDFIAKKRIDAINEAHTNVMAGAYVIESWIIEDEEKDKSVLYGFNLPKGTWMAKVKVTDENLWNEKIKTGKYKGYSVEGVLMHEYTNEVVEMEAVKDAEIKALEELWHTL
jgi:hypothetical protein